MNLKSYAISGSTEITSVYNLRIISNSRNERIHENGIDPITVKSLFFQRYFTLNTWRIRENAICHIKSFSVAKVDCKLVYSLIRRLKTNQLIFQNTKNIFREVSGEGFSVALSSGACQHDGSDGDSAETRVAKIISALLPPSLRLRRPFAQMRFAVSSGLHLIAP